MHLQELIADIEDLSITGNGNVDVRSITADSREVMAGCLFAAFKGEKQDGKMFINDAVVSGAIAVLVDVGSKVEVPDSVCVIEAKYPRRAFAQMAANLLPDQVPFTVAVTGTNGKSSTVSFCRQIWEVLGHKSASIGTVGINVGGMNRYGRLTTPDPVTLHREISELATEGVTHLALEASSQGMDQGRLDGLRTHVAGFLNLTRDHLDYHGSVENYLEAKLHLFKYILPAEGIAVVNSDSDYFEQVKAACDARGITVVDYGRQAQNIQLLAQKPLPEGQFVQVKVFGEVYDIELHLVGEFQAYNALCALGMVLAEDVGNKELREKAVAALSHLKSVRGRLEFAASLPNGAAIYVDYAHTPDALETVLKSIRPHVQYHLHVVVGCGGDRDRGKRPLMGKAAVELADMAIITDDNPRTEDPAFIRSEVMEGAIGATEIGDRREAIRQAIKGLEAGDVLVIAGKGHEQGQEINGEIIPFDDVDEVLKAVNEVY